MKYIKVDELVGRMYQHAFLEDSPMQKWDSGNWIRYKLFENTVKECETIDIPETWWGGCESMMYKANVKIERNDVTELHFGCINVTCIDGAIIYREPDSDNPKDYTARFASLSDATIKNIEITFYRDDNK